MNSPPASLNSLLQSANSYQPARSAAANRSTPAKRSINFPDSPAPEPKRSRLMQEEVRPDSPSVNPGFPLGGGGREDGGGRVVGVGGGEGIPRIPDDEGGMGSADGNSIGSRDEYSGVNSSEPAVSYSSHLWRSLDRFPGSEPGRGEFSGIGRLYNS